MDARAMWWVYGVDLSIWGGVIWDAERWQARLAPFFVWPRRTVTRYAHFTCIQIYE